MKTGMGAPNLTSLAKKWSQNVPNFVKMAKTDDFSGSVMIKAALSASLLNQTSFHCGRHIFIIAVMEFTME